MKDKNAFIGLGFGKEVPIDIVCLFLAGMEAKSYTILIVDEFYRINKMPESQIKSGLEKIQFALNKFKKLYSFNPDVLMSSEFMHTEEYYSILRETTEKVRIVKKDGIHEEYAMYVLNEIACTEYMRRKNMQIKIGPSKEKEYDKLMKEIEFAYVIDAYVLGAKEPCSVVHYVPEHRGISGQRIMIDEPIGKIESKLMLGPDEAERYFLRLASASAHVLENEYMTENEILSLKGTKLKKITRDCVIENIVKPYKEVIL